MVKLEELKKGVQVKGIVPNQIVSIIDIEFHSDDAAAVTYRMENNAIDEHIIDRDIEEHLEIVESENRWQFDEHGNLFQVAAEAYRIRLGHLFDPMLAIHTSLIEPLPHQITAVYEKMLPRQPLRFLLADDPGAGKTIMAGLLIRELVMRGDVHRCLICAPGNLTEQWQDELWDKFQLQFPIITRETAENSLGGNPFIEHNFAIIRLDQVSRNEELRQRLQQTEWDLIVCDEAHKMSASIWGNDIKKTKRYQLGELLGRITRHFLLMTATPHNGKEEDFQLFLALLDADRFEGRFRQGVPHVDVSDMMRRMVKEKLLKFDGKPLFPERRAYTVNYTLSPEERELYEHVTHYVRQEFDRADKLEGGRKNTVGFALTILQRRLASSPEAIYQSLRRRRKRLLKRLQEAKRQHRQYLEYEDLPPLDDEGWEDLEDAPNAEFEETSNKLIDLATAARTLEELEWEIQTLQDLENEALWVRSQGVDRKWQELSKLLENPEMFENGKRRKLVIFTEHRDTLNYLVRNLSNMFGTDEHIVTIHGGIPRQARRKAEDRFRNDPDALILVATDAAGEGINLQRAHLMINYDLPWNPNRLEQRFGRIHRIGQTEVCHLWNLVAAETREGAVYQRLLQKLQIERDALNGQVFDVLGKLFQEQPLYKLLIDAIRYGDRPEIRQKLEQAVDNSLDQERVRQILEEKALATETLDTSQVIRIREQMERAAARRLQPFYIKSFFLRAFEALGGKAHPRAHGRYTITHVPARIRRYAEARGMRPVSPKYERICFEKKAIQIGDGIPAAFICPGHPLFDAVLELTREQLLHILKRGTILVDPTDPGDTPRILFFLEHTIHDGTITTNGQHHVVSQELHFLEIDEHGNIRDGGAAPYLDYRAPTPEEGPFIEPLLAEAWLQNQSLFDRAKSYAISTLATQHKSRVEAQRKKLLDKIETAVQDRLATEIHYWQKRARELRKKERSGKGSTRLNSQQADARAERLKERLNHRLEEIERQRRLTSRRPVIVSAALVVPMGFFPGETPPPEMLDRRITEEIAMRAVLEAEIALGNTPEDVSMHNLGYDIESRDGRTGELRFIEVKGRRADARTVTLTRNELLCALNAPEAFILAIVEVAGNKARPPRYIRHYRYREPDVSEISVNFDLQRLLAHSTEPY